MEENTKKGKLPSRLNPVGRPVKSKESRYAQLMLPNDNRLGYVKGGNLTSGLTSALNGYLGFKGAALDYAREMAYEQAMAEAAEQERQDKLAQQEVENQYKRDMLAQQYNIAKMNNEGANSRALQQHQWALEAENAKRQQAKDEQNLALRQKGIDPDLYGNDPEYTALINDAIKQQALRDQVNTASIELGKSGKVGMDKVGESVATGRPLTYGDNGWFANMIGWNKFGIGKKQPQAQVLTPSDVTRSYQANMQQNAMTAPEQQQPNKMNAEDLWNMAGRK